MQSTQISDEKLEDYYEIWSGYLLEDYSKHFLKGKRIASKQFDYWCNEQEGRWRRNSDFHKKMLDTLK